MMGSKGKRERGRQRKNRRGKFHRLSRRRKWAHRVTSTGFVLHKEQSDGDSCDVQQDLASYANLFNTLDANTIDLELHVLGFNVLEGRYDF